MVNYEEIFEICSLLLFLWVTFNLIADTIMICLIALITGESIWDASQIYEETCGEMYKRIFSFLTIEDEEEDQGEETTQNVEDIPEAFEVVDLSRNNLSTVEDSIGKVEKHLMEVVDEFEEIISQADMRMEQERSVDVQEARRLPRTSARNSAPSVVSPTVSSLLSAIPNKTNNISGRTWRLFYSDTVYKRDNSLRVEWETREKYKAWLRRN